jgi:hypothetical protein
VGDHHGLYDTCPVFPGKRYLDWQLDDPAGKGVAHRLVHDGETVLDIPAKLLGNIRGTTGHRHPYRIHQFCVNVDRRFVGGGEGPGSFYLGIMNVDNASPTVARFAAGVVGLMAAILITLLPSNAMAANGMAATEGPWQARDSAVPSWPVVPGRGRHMDSSPSTSRATWR